MKTLKFFRILSVILSIVGIILIMLFVYFDKRAFFFEELRKSSTGMEKGSVALFLVFVVAGMSFSVLAEILDSGVQQNILRFLANTGFLVGFLISLLIFPILKEIPILINFVMISAGVSKILAGLISRYYSQNEVSIYESS